MEKTTADALSGPVSRFISAIKRIEDASQQVVRNAGAIAANADGYIAGVLFISRTLIE